MSFFFSIALYATLATPFLAAITIYGLSKHRERLSSAVATVSILLLVAETLFCLFSWGYLGFTPQDISFADLYVSEDYRFPICFFFEVKAAVLMTMTSFLGALIIKYSRYYLHREQGYARFFATIFMFLFGMNLLTLAGTLDLLFAGWEVVGISSFLLIGFYRERPIPVRNALRTYYIYRLCDVGILLSVWLAHLVFHASLRFSTLESQLVASHEPAFLLAVMSFLLLFAASGKSAQFPFCFWLPRAMEGPTPSSAIFYGGLSIHAGVFLLLRTEVIWLTVPSARVAMALIGGLSALFSTMSGRVQANIKGQIAYSSIAQVGLMLVELSLGFSSLALFHFVANACLRSYQLLVSPSVVAHLLRVQSAASPGFRLSDWSFERRLPSRLRSTFYALALNEGYLENFLHRCLWAPFLFLGNTLHRFDSKTVRYLAGTTCGLLTGALILGVGPRDILANLLVVLSLLISLFVFSEKAAPFDVWNGVGFSSVLLGIAICGSEMSCDLWVYSSGIVPSWLLGLIALKRLLPKDNTLDLKRFHGLVQKNSGTALLLFFSFIGLVGFPITPTFLGEDLLLHHAPEGHLWITVIITSAFVLNGLTLVRLFTHLCLGPRAKGIPLPPSWRLDAAR